MGKGAAGAGNKAQAQVVNKSAKAKQNIMTDEDMDFKKKQAAEQKALKEAAAKMKKK